MRSATGFRRRCFVLILVTGALAPLPSAATDDDATPPPDAHASPHAVQHPVGIADARWSSGFWADRFTLCHEHALPAMREALLDDSNGANLGNFRVAAGIESGKHRGTNWGDGDCYKWIEAMAWVYAVTRDAELDREMDYWIDLIARSQADDGYIGTQTQLDPDKDRWAQRSYHELYNHGHLLTAACVHHRATGKDTFLAVARRLADYLDRTFSPRPKELAAFGWNPSNIMGLVDLYRVTGERRYLELAGVFISMRGSVRWPHSMWGLTPRVIDPHPGDQNQNRVPLRREDQAVGHAVTGPYLWCGAADVVAETGEAELKRALERLWLDVATRKMYVTGAIGAYHHGVSVRHDLVHEAFGRPYELPQRTAYNETCANIANAMWNRRLLLLSGEAKHGDIVERVLYNSALSPMSLDGRTFCYCNPLRRQHGVELLNHDTPKRLRTMKCYCCPPNVARTIAKSCWWAYGVSEGAVWVNLYGSSELQTKLPDGRAIAIRQQTDYPWQGRVVLHLVEAPAEPVTLRLRIPGWADSASIDINNEPADAPCQPGTYASLRRRWSAGDKVTLNVPMRPVLVQADPRVESTWGQAAVMRGPIVYCAESVDLPDGVSLWNVRLPRDAQWTQRHDVGALGGATLLETDALAVPAEEEPSNKLFGRVASGRPIEFRLQLVPYFAWNNRAETEMTVWLPLR